VTDEIAGLDVGQNTYQPNSACEVKLEKREETFLIAGEKKKNSD